MSPYRSFLKFLFSVFLLAFPLGLFGCGVSSNTYSTSTSQANTTVWGTAILGNLANATVKIYRVEPDGSFTLLYNETTSNGTSLNDIGHFDTHANELKDDEIYVFEVSGGCDWDANDDGVMDSNCTVNKGIIHAVVTGADLKNLSGNFVVSPLTEIHYTMLYSTFRDKDEFLQERDNVSELLLEKDVNSDGNIDSMDVYSFVPNNKEHLDCLSTVLKDSFSYTTSLIESGIVGNVGTYVGIAPVVTLTTGTVKDLTLDANGNIFVLVENNSTGDYLKLYSYNAETGNYSESEYLKLPSQATSTDHTEETVNCTFESIQYINGKILLLYKAIPEYGDPYGSLGVVSSELDSESLLLTGENLNIGYPSFMYTNNNLSDWMFVSGEEGTKWYSVNEDYSFPEIIADLFMESDVLQVVRLGSDLLVLTKYLGNDSYQLSINGSEGSILLTDSEGMLLIPYDEDGAYYVTPSEYGRVYVDDGRVISEKLGNGTSENFVPDFVFATVPVDNSTFVLFSRKNFYIVTIGDTNPTISTYSYSNIIPDFNMEDGIKHVIYQNGKVYLYDSNHIYTISDFSIFLRFLTTEKVPVSCQGDKFIYNGKLYCWNENDKTLSYFNLHDYTDNKTLDLSDWTVNKVLFNQEYGEFLVLTIGSGIYIYNSTLEEISSYSTSDIAAADVWLVGNTNLIFRDFSSGIYKFYSWQENGTLNFLNGYERFDENPSSGLLKGKYVILFDGLRLILVDKDTGEIWKEIDASNFTEEVGDLGNAYFVGTDNGFLLLKPEEVCTVNYPDLGCMEWSYNWNVYVYSLDDNGTLTFETEYDDVLETDEFGEDYAFFYDNNSLYLVVFGTAGTENSVHSLDLKDGALSEISVLEDALNSYEYGDGSIFVKRDSMEVIPYAPLTNIEDISLYRKISFNVLGKMLRN
ncbi:hypothetical protein SAMN06265339_0140 [Desulfurobacterium pacificum]|uniref:Dockerin domain-containing protein n=1 Tax=Desulfurobacterium pacificum TaxID=240166 RepID=A0ABY1NBI3_9BACT|nr:hypothetical protein [Desulfurobacterium pacificum]SMP03721.1 hypothetical protein SAMN06265339_0140 [Desulfurobacterium pacificum]